MAQEAPAPISVQWTDLGEDLQLGHAALEGGSLLGADLRLVRSSLKRYRVGVVDAASELHRPRASVRTLARATGAVVGVNANFFDEQGLPLGLIISRGNNLHRMHMGGTTLTGVFYATRNSIGIKNRAEFRGEAVLEAVQAGPRLMADGKLLSGLRDTASVSRRAGVCIDERRNLIIYCVASGLRGLALSDLTAILADPRINCRETLNLDGGGSAQLYVARSEFLKGEGGEDLMVEGRDEIPVMLGLFRREF